MTGIIVSTPPSVELPPSNNPNNPSSLPGVTYQYALLTLPQTWGAKQTFPLGDISLNAADITGTIPSGSLPPPTASTLGGVESIAAVSHQWINSISTSGVPSLSQPAFSDISGGISTSQMNSGTLASAGAFWRGDGAWTNGLISPSATSATTFIPRMFSILDGNITGGQVTTQRTPTALFSRNENIADNGTSDGSDGPALYSVVTTSGTQQAVACSALGYAYPASGCDIVGVYGAASQNGTAGTHTAFGGFFYGIANVAGSGAIGTQNQIQNNTGIDKPYNPATLLGGSPFMVGADIAYSSTPAKLAQAGVLIRAGTGSWDVGVALINGVNSADIRTDTTSATILLAGPTAHVHGIDLTSATFSGAAFRSPNFNVDGTTGNITSAGGAYTQTTPTPTSTAGTFTTVSSTVREKKVGKIVHVQIAITVTSIGSASGSILVNLPTSALNPVAGSFGDLSNAGIVGTAILIGGGAIVTPSGGIVNGHNYLATFIYEGV